MVNAVSSFLSSSISTCQYQDFRSSKENNWDPCKMSRASLIQGSEYASVTVWLFSFPRSIQNLRFPSFLDQDHCASQWTVWFSDGTNIQHLLKVGLHIIVHMVVFTSSALWRPSGQLTQFGVWWGMSFPGPSHCRQTGVPILPAASWPILVPPWATPLGPGVSVPPGSNLSWGHRWASLRVPLEEPLVAPFGQSKLTNCHLGRDY